MKKRKIKPEPKRSRTAKKACSGRELSTDFETTTHSEEKTFELARTMARRFKGKEVVLLSGELGAG